MFLYYITDRGQLSTDPEESVRLLLDRVRLAAAAGVDAIQLREKDLSARELVDLGRRAIEIVGKANSISESKPRTRLLINSRTDVAIACGADGVHLRADDVSAADARSVFMQSGIAQPLIGVSAHSLRAVKLAQANGADFAVFGPVFGKSNTKSAAVGVAALAKICHTCKRAPSSIPILALGGIDFGNAAKCLEAGASGVAGIRLFQKGDVSEAVSRLRKLG